MVNENSEINLNEVYISFDETYHIYKNKPLYERKFMSVMSFHPPGVAAVKDGRHAYHVNLEGEPIYEKRFLKTFGYYSEIAAVNDNSGWYHINFSGIPVYNERYDWVGNFQEETCPVRDIYSHYFHIKKDGSLTYGEKYRYVGDFKYGIAVVYGEDGYAKHIDREGKLIHDRSYEELGVFHKGYAIAKDEDGYLHINKKGEPLYNQRYQGVEPFYNGFSLVSNQYGQKMIIDEQGNCIHTIYDENSKLVRESSRNDLMDKLVSYWKTQIIYSIVKLRVLEHIKSGKNTFQTLIEEINIPQQSLDIILKVLVLWHFITEEKGIYQVRYIGDLLTEDNPKSLKYAAIMWGEEHYLIMAKLLDALKTYKPQFKEMFGNDFFQYLNKNEEKCDTYNRAMLEYSIDYDEIIKLYDFNNSKVIIDIGGGSGVLLSKIIKKFNNINKGILFDLPNIVENARVLLQNHEMREKIEFMSGNFLDNIPIKADAILMSRIIHDWDDNNAIKILRNVHNSLEDNGHLLIFETIVPEDLKKDIGITLDFNLLVCVGGKERTLEEFKYILNETGFKIETIKKEKGTISIIIANKKKK
ncbi:MAG: methyltransferase [Candidatus Lokiarchaeia archaeon]